MLVLRYYDDDDLEEAFFAFHNVKKSNGSGGSIID
jgi:hypothetical protein